MNNQWKKLSQIRFNSHHIHLADIDLRQKCIHLRHNLFAPILLLRHLFVQAMGIICANKIDIHLRHCYKFIFYFKDIYFKETNLMTSLLFYPDMGPAVLTLAELMSFIIKYDKLKRKYLYS